MVRKDTDPVGRLFARLTGALEDATELATEGQNRALSISERLSLALRLHHRLGRADAALEEIDHALSNGDDL